MILEPIMMMAKYFRWIRNIQVRQHIIYCLTIPNDKMIELIYVSFPVTVQIKIKAECLTP